MCFSSIRILWMTPSLTGIYQLNTIEAVIDDAVACDLLMRNITDIPAEQLGQNQQKTRRKIA